MNYTSDTAKPLDAARGHWVDHAPRAVQPYLRLVRLDRPIGTWLLLWPCWWGLALGSLETGWSVHDLWLFALFGIGAVVMRGAGCTFNDIVDRDFDAKVERTRGRPIPSGQVSVRNAVLFMIAQALIGLCVLLTLNDFTRLLGIASLGIVAIYPFMKRVTYWPQAVLGLAFNWGALMGYAAQTGTLRIEALLLYAAGIAWTLGYDTIYAHQDKDDDAIIGVKSTALKFGATTAKWLTGFYGAAFVLVVAAGTAAHLALGFYLLLFPFAAHLTWQIQALDVDDPVQCLTLFRANRETGALVFLALIGATLVDLITRMAFKI